MGLKTAGVGHFAIPTAPAAGTSCTSGAANTFTTTYVVLSASTPSALFVTGIHVESSAALGATYIVVQLATGGAGSEAVVGQYLVPLSTASTVALGYRQIYPPILIANGTRVACKTADSVGAKATLITLECIAQSNVVDDGVAVAVVSAVTGLTASNLDAAVSSRMATYTQPTGFLAATFPTTVASTTNITAGTITTVTTLTNLPAITAGWLTATGIAASALNGKGDWNIGKTGYTLTQTFPTNFSALAVTAGGAVTAGTVSDKTGYSLVAGYDPAKTAAQAGDAMTLTAAYAAAKTAAQAGDSMALTIAERASVADALLARNVSGGSSAGRTVKQALAVLRNKVEVVAGTLTVYDTDDTTALFTAAVTTAAGNPVSSIDPA